MVSNFLYSRSHFCSKLQKLLSIYFKFKGLTAKGCDTLHYFGVTMSSKWTTDAVENVSKEAMQEVREKVEQYLSITAHDNVHIPFRIFSQRLDHHAENGHGTAAVVYIKQDTPHFSPGINRLLQETRAAGMANPLNAADIIRIAQEGWLQIEHHMVDYVLHVLLNSSEFALKSYPEETSPAFAPPPPVKLLPCGPAHTVRQYLLGSMSTKEQSYEDNDRVVKEVLQQLGITTENIDRLRELGEERLMFWVGDQLTASRLRGLARYRCQDSNAFDRMDYIVVIWGWLHYQMAFAKSIHKQYLGTEAGFGLKHAFALLRRRGLDTASTQGPFHDNIEHAFYDIMDAWIRALWLVQSGVERLEDLRSRPAEELHSLAEDIVRHHASSRAVDVERLKGDGADRIRQQGIMFNRDVLLYIVLDQAIKVGDVGLMENILPHALLRFIGGRNSKYAIETLEMLQGLHCEWPEEVA